MTLLAKDTRGFVNSVVANLRKEGKAPTQLPRLQEMLRRISMRAKNEHVALVSSSIALTNPEKHRIETALARIIGSPMTLECSVNPELLGGVRIQVADWIVDSTIAGQLETMKHAII